MIEKIIKFTGIISVVYTILNKQYLLTIIILLSFVCIALGDIHKSIKNDK